MNRLNSKSLRNRPRSLSLRARIASMAALLALGAMQGPFGLQIVRGQGSGLVAVYGFEEGSGATAADSSGAGNTGTIAGATWTASGRFGNALSFDGSTSRVTIADSPSLDLTNALTLEAWVLPTATPVWWHALIAKDVDRYYLAASDNQNRPAIGGTFGSTNQNVSAGGSLPVNVWTHLAATYDRTTIRLYANGVEVATGSQTAAVSTSNAALNIGANVYGEHFAGLIDEGTYLQPCADRY